MQQAAMMRDLRLSNYMALKQVATLTQKVESFTMLVHAVVNSDYPRVNKLLSRHLQAGRSIHFCIDLLKDATAFVYGWIDMEKALGTLVNCIGGPRLLASFVAARYLPSTDTCTRAVNSSPPIPPDGVITENRLLALLDTVAVGTKILFDVVMDEIYVEQRLRAERIDTPVAGLCSLHADGHVFVDSIEAAHELRHFNWQEAFGHCSNCCCSTTSYYNRLQPQGNNDCWDVPSIQP